MVESVAHEKLRLAVQRAGGQSALARIVGCSQSNISLLLKNRKPLPAEYVLAAEAATGISRFDLRPDVYGSPPEIPAFETRSGADA